MKLSKTQIDVLSLMQEGWELLVTNTAGLRYTRLQGYGWEGRKNVSYSTVMALKRRGYIKPIHGGFPTTKWVLTELGKEADNESSNPDLPVVGAAKPD